MNDWVNYLLANPVLALVMVVILLLFVFMALKRLMKWALIAFVVLIAAAGLTYRNSQKPQFLERLEKKAEEIIEKGKDLKEEASKSIEALKEHLEE